MKLWPEASHAYLHDPGSNITAASTRRTAHQSYGQLQRAHPDFELRDFQEEHLLAWCRRDGIAPGTQRRCRNQVIGLFSWATWKGLIKRDPSANLKRLMRVPLRPARHHNWLSQQQAGELVATQSWTDGPQSRRNRLLLQLPLMTGLRVTEFRTLTWDQVDLPSRKIRLIGKGNKAATVGIPEQLAEPLGEWFGEATEGLAVRPSAQPVFPSSRNCWIDPSVSLTEHERIIMWDRELTGGRIGQIVKEAGTEIGVPNLAPHDLRRSFAGILDALGVDIRDIQAAMRHDSVSTTERYLKTNPNRGAEATASLQFALGG
ncbi:MAG: tyrosine-type recombinase/integrase [Actinomycetota bacterium]